MNKNKKAFTYSVVHAKTLKFKGPNPTKLLSIHWKNRDHN